MRVLRFAVVAAGLLMAAGCGWGTTGPVAGVVTRGGKPLAGVQVCFLMSEKGIAAATATDSAGRYAFDVPLDAGTYAVYVTSLPPEPGQPGSPPPMPQSADIPRRYRDPMTSELTCVVRPARNTYTIDLAD